MHINNMLRSLPKLSLLFSSTRSPHYVARAQRFLYTGTTIKRAASRVKIGVTIPVHIQSMSTSTIASISAPEMVAEDQLQQIKLLTSRDDAYGGVIVDLDQSMDSATFVTILRASISHWKQLGKKGLWIKVPIHLVNLVEALVKEGFGYHHAEPKYLMLVYWIPESPSTIPANATHRVGIGSFVMNEKKEVLVVQENSGHFQGTGVWKFPTGVVDQGEDICVAAVREVKEETGVDSEFVEVLAFRFILRVHVATSVFDIQIQRLEIEGAQWMSFEEYAAQPFIQKSELLKYINDVCLTKTDGTSSGFCPVSTSSNFSDQKSYLYLNVGALKKPNSF